MCSVWLCPGFCLTAGNMEKTLQGETEKARQVWGPCLVIGTLQKHPLPEGEEADAQDDAVDR